MVKTPDEVALIRVAGKIRAYVFEILDGHEFADCRSTILSTASSQWASQPVRLATSKRQYRFKHVLNCSINHEVCPGVPDPGGIIHDGDVVNFGIRLEKAVISPILARPSSLAMPARRDAAGANRSEGDVEKYKTGPAESLSR